MNILKISLISCLSAICPVCLYTQAIDSTRRCILTMLMLILSIGLHAQTHNLDYYIDAALQNSPLLKDYQNQIVINRLDSLIHKAGYKPQADLSSTNVYAPNIKGWGYDTGIINNGTFNVLLTVRQTIIGKGNKKTQLQSYSIENQALQNTAKISEQDLKLAVASQYVASYHVLQETLYNKELLDLLKKEEGVLKKLTEKAVYKQTDYLNFLISLKQQQLLIDQQTADYKNNIALLNYVCGIVDTAYVGLKNPNIALLLPPSFENTLQYERFRIDSLKLKNSDDQIDYAYHPKLEIFTDAGFNSTLTYQAYKNFGASVGLSLIMPLYDGGQRQKQHNKIRASEQIRQSYLDFSRNRYRQQLAQLYQQLQQTDDIIRQAREVVDYTQVLVEAHGKLLQTGNASVTDYVLAVNNLLNARHTVVQSMNNRMQIINQINYWNYEK